MGESPRPGFHGKLPSRGDFLTRGLPRGFVEPWDDWLQRGIAASRESVGDDWLAIYLESPVWRFALAAGACGPSPVAGIFLPSVDKVGRYFPFTVAQVLEPEASLVAVPEWSEWFERIESRALGALEDDALEPGTLHEELRADAAPESQATSAAPLTDSPVAAIPIEDASRPADGLRGLSNALLASRFATPALWWTNGSDLCPPLLLASNGLADFASYEIFLSGRVG